MATSLEFDMATIKMTSNDRGAPHGHTVVEYREGEEYEVPQWLADYFVEKDSAEIVGSDSKKADKSPKK